MVNVWCKVVQVEQSGKCLVQSCTNLEQSGKSLEQSGTLELSSIMPSVSFDSVSWQ